MCLSGVDVGGGGIYDNMEIDRNRKVEFVGGCVHADQV